MKRTLALLLTLGILLSFAVTPAYADSDLPYPPIVGDVDGDHVVTIIDATFLQRHLLSINIPCEYDEGTADADEDGDVTIMDVTNIQRWLNGISDRLNIGKEVIPWFDKADAYAADYFDGGYFTVYRVCKTHFYAFNEEYGMLYKLNGSLPEKFGLNDEVYCSFDNIYIPLDNSQIAEADWQSIAWAYEVPDPYMCYKPVIYLYPEEETDVDVQLDLDGSLLTTKPAYEDGWEVTASPDGTIKTQDGKTYPYLFWEGKLNTTYDFSTGFCIKGSDTESFLKESLAELGLNQQESDDFIHFWLPFMKRNPYNVISFQTAAYTDAAQLNISPQPDTTIRVFMAWYASEDAVDIPAQTLPSAERTGFTAVEWGGAMAPSPLSD